MKCLVCQAAWPDAADAEQQRCPQCAYDHAAAGAREPSRIQAARRAFRDRSSAFAPNTRVSALDRKGPWLALVIGFGLFVLWLRACSSGGRFW